MLVNRKVRARKVLRRIRHVTAENGVRWTSYFLAVAALRRATQRLERAMRRLELRHGLPGTNTVLANYKTWQEWEWSQQGEEWTVSPEWKQALIDEVLLKYIAPGRTVLEIGPGAGRWTETLQRIARHLIVVDLSDKCIAMCRQRFANAGNMEFHVNDGKSLRFVPTGSVDFVWSFDVFVHIAPPEINKYLAEISRVLKPKGRGIIHHAKVGNDRVEGDRGWRSSMTAALFDELLRKNGLRLVTRFDSWGPAGQYDVKTYGDTITVFEK